MADFQEMLDFPPTPKLDVFGKLDPVKATAAEMRGQEIFGGKGQCASCHQPPFYTDNLMHNLQTERFFKPVMINRMMAIADGPIKTFPLPGEVERIQYHLITRFSVLCLTRRVVHAFPWKCGHSQERSRGASDLPMPIAIAIRRNLDSRKLTPVVRCSGICRLNGFR
jgi:hypothetical protein